MCTDRSRRQRGVTLIEMIFFIVIVSVALAGLMQVFNLVTRDSADPMRRKQALMLAEAMMAEVQQAGFTFCDPTDDNAATAADRAGCANTALQEKFGPEQPSLRPFDNVNDYVSGDGVPTQAFGPVNGLQDVNLNAIDVRGYTAELTIRPVPLGDIGNTTVDSDVLQITVVVTYDAGQSVRLDGYRLRYAPQFL
jgi:MSHA pilin protein MshD